MISFVLAHEHAHHCLGHLDELSLRRIKRGPEFSTFSRSQQQEFEADRLGFQIFLQCRNPESTYNLHNLEPFPTAPLVFFAWLQTMEELMNTADKILYKVKNSGKNMVMGARI